MDITVRRATMADYERLCELYAEVDALHVGAHPELFRMAEPPREWAHIQGMLEGADSTILVAEVEGVIAGFALLVVKDTPPVPVIAPRHFAVVDTLGVGENYRRSGVGRALMEQAEQFAREHGARDIELSVYRFNQAAVQFYEELGYQTASFKMRKSVENSE